MIRIRLHNDIPLKWSFFAKNELGERVPYSLEGKDIKVEMTDCRGGRIVVDPYVSGNYITWTFRGKVQKVLGAYDCTLYENFGLDGMKAIDKVRPFELVARQESIARRTIEGCCSTMEVEPIELVSDFSDIVSYESLADLPKINHIVLIGDRMPEELGIEPKHPYLSLERLRRYLYRVTFDSLPEDNGGDSPVAGGCSSYVRDGKLYSNLDWDYDNTASFIIRTRDFEGQSFIRGLDDGNLDDALIAQLPYRIHRGVNNYGIKLAAHILYNDWRWTGCGDKSINLTRLPFLILSRVRSMATIAADLDGVLDNLYCPEGLAELGYLLQVIVTDGTTTYAILPPTSEGQSYVIQDITVNPKLTNFRWVASAQVARTELQTRPTGVERWNIMPCPLEDLRFTLAYESPARLSEFIGLRGTTKDSTDAQLEAIYADARTEYLTRERDGKTWHTMESAVYGDRLEALYIQEGWSKNQIPATTEYVDKAEEELAKMCARIKGFSIGATLHLELSQFLSYVGNTIYITSPYASADSTTHKILI